MNWKQALSLGLCSVGEVKKEPVAYSYNGVVLPKLPEWDKERFQKVCIVYLEVAGGYILLGSAGEPNEIIGNNPPYHRYEKDIPSMECNLSNGAWGGIRYTEWVNQRHAYNFSDYDTVVWSNYDILNEDGTIWLAKSDPIPVYA